MPNFFLVENQLWSEFHSLDNEMIITKHGRCMFPLLRFLFNLSAGEKDEFICIGITIFRIDGLRWKYKNGKWMNNGYERNFHPNEKCCETPIVNDLSDAQQTIKNTIRIYEPHKNAIKLAEHREISFARVKLTNQALHHSDEPNIKREEAIEMEHVFPLKSFCRYQPVLIWCKAIRRDKNLLWHMKNFPENIQFVSFDCTRFYAVTHYQNMKITNLKKAYNPHAKGFLINENTHIDREEKIKQQEQKENFIDLSSIDDEQYIASKALEKLSSGASSCNSSLLPSRSISPIKNSFSKAKNSSEENIHFSSSSLLPSDWSWHYHQ